MQTLTLEQIEQLKINHSALQIQLAAAIVLLKREPFIISPERFCTISRLVESYKQDIAQIESLLTTTAVIVKP